MRFEDWVVDSIRHMRRNIVTGEEVTEEMWRLMLAAVSSNGIKVEAKTLKDITIEFLHQQRSEEETRRIRESFEAQSARYVEMFPAIDNTWHPCDLCDTPIEPGTAVRVQGEWCHEECAEAEGMEFQRTQKRGVPGVSVHEVVRYKPIYAMRCHICRVNYDLDTTECERCGRYVTRVEVLM